MCIKIRLKWGIFFYFIEEIQIVEIMFVFEMVINKLFIFNVIYDGR